MIRTIRCTDCGPKAQLQADDIESGWEQRKVQGVATKPNLQCDQCGIPLQEGTLITAVTRWRHEDAPPDWEIEYLTPASIDDQLGALPNNSYFDVDTDIRLDTDSRVFHQRPVFAQDEGGDYGSIFDKERDAEIPEPD